MQRQKLRRPQSNQARRARRQQAQPLQPLNQPPPRTISKQGNKGHAARHGPFFSQILRKLLAFDQNLSQTRPSHLPEYPATNPAPVPTVWFASLTFLAPVLNSFPIFKVFPIRYIYCDVISAPLI